MCGCSLSHAALFMPHHCDRPLALTLYAPPKSGSTFLSTFLKHLATASSLCHVSVSRHRCAHSVAIGCSGGGSTRPPCQEHGNSRRCVWPTLARQEWRLSQSCCDAVDPANTSELMDEPASSAHSHASRSAWWEDVTSCERGGAAARWLDEQPHEWLWGDRNGSGLHATLDHPRMSRATRNRLRDGFIHGPVRLLPRPSDANTTAATTTTTSITTAWPTKQHHSNRPSSPSSRPSPPFSRPSSPLQPLGAADGVHRGMSTLLILHTRHPIETLVSHYYCVSSRAVCPKRHAGMQATRQARAGGGGVTNLTSSPRDGHSSARLYLSDANSSVHDAHLEAFLFEELSGGEATSLNRLLARLERLAAILERARHSAAQPSEGAARRRAMGVEEKGIHEVGAAGQAVSFVDLTQPPLARMRPRGGDCGHEQPHVTVLLSRYEHMVTRFPSWLNALLHALPDSLTKDDRSASAGRHVGRNGIESSLREAFQSDFVTDGGHRHALKPGSNLARLSAGALARLQAHPRIASLMRRLGYEQRSDGRAFFMVAH